MPMTEQLKVGEIVFHHGQPIKLLAFVHDIDLNAYWWAETTFTEHPETLMFALPHGHTYQLLHTQRVA